MIDDKAVALSFSGLANPSRVAIFRQLLKRHPLPLLFGELSKCCAIPPSTLKHHLSELERAGIVTSKSSGRSTEFRVETAPLENLLRQFLAECCVGENEKETACPKES